MLIHPLFDMDTTVHELDPSITDLSTFEGRMRLAEDIRWECGERYGMEQGLVLTVWMVVHRRPNGKPCHSLLLKFREPPLMVIALSDNPQKRSEVLRENLENCARDFAASALFVGSEAWSVVQRRDAPRPTGNLEHHPDRHSILSLAGEIRDGNGKVVRKAWRSMVEGDGKGEPGPWEEYTPRGGILTSILSELDS